MILPIQHTVRGRLIEAVGRLYGIPPDDPALAAIAVEMPRRAARSAISPCRSRSSSRAGCARRRAPSRRRSPPRSARSRASRASRPRRTATSTSSSTAGPRSRAGWPSAQAPPSDRRRQDHRRAHGDQPEQGGAHRPSAQRRARRRVRPAASLPGPHGRDPELHRRHRRPGRGRRGRLPRARSTRRSTRSATIADAGRFDYYCWDLYARVTEWYEEDKERLKIRADGAPRHRARRQRHRRPRRTSSPTASSAAICGRCGG